MGLPAEEEDGGMGAERGLKGRVSVGTVCGICGGGGMEQDCTLALFFSRAVISVLISKTKIK